MYFSNAKSYLVGISHVFLVYPDNFPRSRIVQYTSVPPRWNYTDVTSIYHLKSLLLFICIVITNETRNNYFKPLSVKIKQNDC